MDMAITYIRVPCDVPLLKEEEHIWFRVGISTVFKIILVLPIQGGLGAPPGLIIYIPFDAS